MRILCWLILGLAVASCTTPPPAQEPAVPIPSPVPSVVSPGMLRKVGPDLRQHLLQRGRQAIQAPESLEQQLRPVTVVIQARQDITEALSSHGAKVRSVTLDRNVVVITADVPLAAIPSALGLPQVETIELTKPVPPAREGSDDG